MSRYGKHPLRLPRHPQVVFEYEYVMIGPDKELVATCSQCHRRHRVGINLGEQIPEEAISRIKYRFHRYHICSADGFAAIPDAQGIGAVMDAFGFPEWLKPRHSEEQSLPRKGRHDDKS